MSEQTPVYTTPGCPLWVDTTNSTFNVDDPTFWTPMSVISGLASGFCERMAVAKIASAGGTVETGAKATLVTGKTWTIGATTDPALGSNNAIVSNVAHGFATGTTGATLYNTHDASFQTVGTSAGANYMKAVDDAITSMVTMQSSYVDANGAAYSFTTLANAAVTRAAASGSSILTPVKDGTNSNAPFAPAYPVEWAKERKWMLDQLRWTGGGVVEPKVVTNAFYNIYDVYGPNNEHVYDAGVWGTTVGLAISAAYNAAVTGGTENVTSLGTAEINYRGPLFNYQVGITGDTVCTITAPRTHNQRIPYTMYFVYNNPTVDDKIQAYCGAHNYAAEIYTLWDEGTAVKIGPGTASIAAAQNTNYILVDGASVSIIGGNTVGNVIVSEGCTAVIGASVTVPKLCIMDGGRVTVPAPTTGNTYTANIDEFYVNYRYAMCDSALYDVKYVNGATPVAAEQDISYLVNGGTLSMGANIAASRVVVSGTVNNPGKVVVTGPYAVQDNILIGPHGSVLATGQGPDTGNALATRICIMSGGYMSAGDIPIGIVNVMSGGSLDINNCSVNVLGLYDGAVVNINGNNMLTSTGTGGTAILSIEKIGDIRVGTYDTFAFDADTLKPNSWNTLNVTNVTGTSAFVSSVTRDTAATASAHMATAPLVGGTIGNATLPTSTALLTLSGARIWRNFSVLAINGGTATGDVREDHYKDFRVRQYANYDQSETPQT